MTAPTPLECKVQTVGLVVDDDAVMRMVVREVLEREGFEVQEAANGREGLARFSSTKPDIVLLDVMMPEMDGYAACAAIRALPEGTRTPILMMTGLDDLESINRAFEAGATDFIGKPINWGVLGHRIRYLLRSARTLEQLVRNQESLAEAQSIARLGSWEWDVENDRVYLSPELHDILDFGQDVDPGTFPAFMDRLFPDKANPARETMERLSKSGESIDASQRLVMRDGSIRHIHILGHMRRTEETSTRIMAGTIQDITERKHAEDQIRYLAYYDALTKLPNRHLFDEQLQHSLSAAKRHDRLLAVLSLDLDQFKRINDSLGHNLGDELLQAVARRLEECVRSEDAVARSDSAAFDRLARLGGDEFSIMLTDITQFHDAAKVAGRILAQFQQPFRLGKREVVVTTSAGIALFPTDGDTPEALIKNADTALHYAKEQGRNNYQFYSQDMNSTALEKLSMEALLRRALEHDQLILYYQPKVEANSGRIVGAEALVRWKHPELGIVAPNQFIPIAEEIGLIIPIGDWVLKTATLQAKAWQEEGFLPISVAVNIAGSHFRHGNLAESVGGALRGAGLDPRYLEVELTESMLMDNVEATIATLRNLKEMGITLAIDDFGTGYSSLAYLKRFPLDALKIDRSFIKDTPGDADDAALTTAIIGMAHSLHLKVVAEGIENQPQFDFLRDRGCDLIQGYLISRPVPPDDFRALMKKAVVTEQPVGAV